MLPLVIAIAAALPEAATPAPPPAVKCEYDPRVLDLGFDAFDQDMNGGWRALSDKPGCEEKAAGIIRDYRVKYESIIPLLYWHEAQLIADTGKVSEAVSLMNNSYQHGLKDTTGWNHYVRATIAFLQGDKAAFLNARNGLDHLQKPENWPRDEEWPQNNSVVEGLWKCFGMPYKIAYGVNCRPKLRGPR